MFGPGYELEVLSGKPTSRSEVPESDSAKNAQTQLTLDLAFDYAAAGFWGETKDLLSGYVSKSVQAYPIALYLLGYCERRLGNHAEAIATWDNAANALPDYCFPARVEEMIVLQAALADNPSDARAHCYLGNLFYVTRSATKRQSASGNRVYRSIHLLPFLGEISGLHTSMFERMQMRHSPHITVRSKANPSDARLLYEADQLAQAYREPAHLNAWQTLENHSDSSRNGTI